MHLRKGAKNLGMDIPPPHLDKIQKTAGPVPVPYSIYAWCWFPLDQAGYL